MMLKQLPEPILNESFSGLAIFPWNTSGNSKVFGRIV